MNQTVGAFVLGLSLLAGCAGSGAPTTASLASQSTEDAAAPTLSTHADTLAALTAAERSPADRPANVRRQDQTYFVLNLEFADAASCAKYNVPAAPAFNRFQKWADIYLPNDADVEKAVRGSAGFVWLETACDEFVPPEPPAKEEASRAKADEIVRAGLQGLTGKGVIVVVVDTGIDFRHPDFITRDASGKPTSRVLALWDTTSDDFDAKQVGSKPPISYPNGASVGTVYTRDQLTADLRAATKTIGVTDAHGHGTACAGVAAGNGSANRRNTGVAPDADIVAVRLGSSKKGSLENGYVIGAACAWIDSIAGTQPVVISCSYGGHSGGHDGAKIVERQLDARFASNVKGRALCYAAGNEGTYKFHGETTFSAAKGGELTWTVPNTIKKGQINVYFDGGRATTIGAAIWGPAATVKHAKGRFEFNPITMQHSYIAESPPGTYTVKFSTKSTKTVRADGYVFPYKHDDNRPLCFFDPACASLSRQVGTPGTTSQAITVGSYDFNEELPFSKKTITQGSASGGPITIGSISGYSSPGPHRGGDLTRPKPEIAAPGQWHMAAFPTQVCGMEGMRTAPQENYGAFNGTSAATPYVAGVIALMLQKNPDLTVGEIRELVCKAARKDGFTKAVPNTQWGCGKLDFAAVKALLTSVKVK